MPLPTARLAILTILVAAAGCGEQFGTIPVVGRVTVGGAAPPAPGYLYFVPARQGPPAADGSGPRSGSARWGADGGFAVGTFRAADGLRPGRYKVRIDCDLGGQQPGADYDGRPLKGRPLVPAGFRPPELLVPADSSGPVQYDLDVPQASAGCRGPWQLAGWQADQAKTCVSLSMEADRVSVSST